jgi:hypothetical protein
MGVIAMATSLVEAERARRPRAQASAVRRAASAGVPVRAGQIGPIRREIIFEPVHEQPPPAEPAPAEPAAPEPPREPVPEPA